ncbi:LPXTG cell wall anchor domain-containing protein [Corynebacterium sp.]|uniref:LPXTG cell wall anchor domain-containing protein n=1 Tax=Corynebacterium sp. TaxID=1720 RepID=UPI0026DF447F|nr:LPXTG cell wall anchor domain-containing protein [Corynebacterium sp.]MDO5513467.1 LPXTG cell wall anchor domain-containing protein [Corynebacterium sp.]
MPTQVQQPQPQQTQSQVLGAQQTPARSAPPQVAPQQAQRAQQNPHRVLANTGADTIAVVLIALVMVLIGGAIIISRRRAE